MNGYDERCRQRESPRRSSRISELKMGHTTIGRENLGQLTSTARFIAELANLPLRSDQPFVGNSAFAHKGGVHVAAVLKDAATYEHINPKVIGNRQRVLLSDLSGKEASFISSSSMASKNALTTPRAANCSTASSKWSFKGMSSKPPRERSRLLVREALRPGQQLFEVIGYEVTTRATGSTATVTLKQDGVHSATATGNGPVNALDLCLRQCLATLYPSIADVKLTDYQVRVLDFKKGTAARVRVLVEWFDHRRSWTTVGVSENVVETKLVRFGRCPAPRTDAYQRKDPQIDRAVEDYCWGV